jgi:hypothetical protein
MAGLVGSRLLAVTAVKGGHGAIGFSFDRFLFEVVPFVDGRLPFSHADFDLYPAVLPIEPEGDKGLAVDGASLKKLSNFGFVEEELATALRFVLRMTGAFVRLNIRVVEVNLAILDPGKGVVEIGKTGPDRFDLGSLQRDAGLYPIENLIVMERASIGSDLGGHKPLPLG